MRIGDTGQQLKLLKSTQTTDKQDTTKINVLHLENKPSTIVCRNEHCVNIVCGMNTIKCKILFYTFTYTNTLNCEVEL